MSEIYKTEVKRRVSWRKAKVQIGAVSPKKKNVFAMWQYLWKSVRVYVCMQERVHVDSKTFLVSRIADDGQSLKN
jgi:hypothetical protein